MLCSAKMGKQSFILRLCIIKAGLICTAGGSAHVTAEPDSISDGTTMSLDVNCTFSNNDTSGVSSLISLIVSKGDLQSNATDNFQDVTSINTFAPTPVTLVNISATSTGYINGTFAFLNLHFEYPSTNTVGEYMCKAIGIDYVGHSVEMSDTAQVKLGNSDTDIPKDTTQLQQQIEQLLMKQSALEALLDQYKNRLDILEELQRNQTEYHKNKTSVFFEKSQEYNGRYYLLSKQNPDHIDVAEFICQHKGGYLAEIDDALEHEFIKKFLNNTFATRVKVGVTFDTQAGMWRFRSDGRNITYSDWDFKYVNDPSSDVCMELLKGDWAMDYYRCYLMEKVVFLCEIPVQ